MQRVLLIVGGGIAAYKTPYLVRRLRERSVAVRCVLTRAGAQFVTPLTLGSVSGDKVYDDLFSLTDEAEMGHIELSREADLLVVAPATADLMAKMAAGLADDLASTALLATDKPVLVAPAMNVRMWEHPATQANLETLRNRGVTVVGPDEGDMACGEFGYGRMSEPEEIVKAIQSMSQEAGRPLTGRRVLVTSGPTREPIDPVRYISNHSSGKQGHAIAGALHRLGADTTLVTGPVATPDPIGVRTVRVETAEQMLAACLDGLPVDAAVFAAAISDWRPAAKANSKIKKTPGGPPPSLAFTENPDILATVAARSGDRPKLVVGFAAETDDVVENAVAKRARKGCDWMLANDVSEGAGTFGGDHTHIHMIGSDGSVEDWAPMTKAQVADKLARRVAGFLTEAAE